MLKWKGRKKMFITKIIRGMILVKGKDDTYHPPIGQSSRWKHWMTEQDPKVCSACEAMQGQIYSLYEDVIRRHRCIQTAAVKSK